MRCRKETWELGDKGRKVRVNTNGRRETRRIEDEKVTTRG